MRWNLDDLPIFRAVAEQGGITAAAETLDRPKSSVSAALARLEGALGVKLVERGARALRLTPEGETFLAQTAPILDQAAEADAVMTGLTAVPSGRLSVALPGAFCQEILAPRLPEFRARYPGIALQISLSGRGSDPDGIDVAVVVGEQPDSGLTRRVLLGGRLIWIAAPDLAANLPPDLPVEALAARIAICESRYARGPLPVTVAGQHHALAIPPGAIRVNDPLSVRRAVQGGIGLGFLPERYCRTQIAAGHLVEIRPDIAFDMGAARLSAVYPSGRLLSARVRVFVDFLSTICRETPA